MNDRPKIEMSREAILNMVDGKNELTREEIFIFSSITPYSLVKDLEIESNDPDRYSMLKLQKDNLAYLLNSVFKVLDSSEPLELTHIDYQKQVLEELSKQKLNPQIENAMKYFMTFKYLMSEGYPHFHPKKFIGKVPRKGILSFRQSKANEWYGAFMKQIQEAVKHILVKTNTNKELAKVYVNWVIMHYIEMEFPDIYHQGNEESTNDYVYRVMLDILPK